MTLRERARHKKRYMSQFLHFTVCKGCVREILLPKEVSHALGEGPAFQGEKIKEAVSVTVVKGLIGLGLGSWFQGASVHDIRGGKGELFGG